MHNLFCTPAAQHHELKDDCRHCAYGNNRRGQPRPVAVDRAAGSARWCLSVPPSAIGLNQDHSAPLPLVLRLTGTAGRS
jgi:hypothetical protein